LISGSLFGANVTNNQLDTLNPEQKEAAYHTDSPLLIIAGAGSGKTKVITNKFAHLITKKNYSPLNILGLTFTNKAAGEMKNRIESLTKIDAKLFNISTFHSMGLKMLRESGSFSGYDKDWHIVDDQDQRMIIERIIKDQYKEYSNDLRDTAIRRINQAKMRLNYPNDPEALLQMGFDENELKTFTLYFKYQKEKKLWDYEDLVSLPVKLLQSSELFRQKINQKYKYVLVDEFQDTNPNQYEMVKLLAEKHKNITVVGDDDQAIYAWRGASIRFLFQFEQDFPRTRIIKLEQNYRSTPEILSFANNIIKNNTYRRSKFMWTNKLSGKPVYFINTISKEAEAEKTADLIIQTQQHRPDLFPMAILYRINSQSLAFETEFLKRNINFQIIKGTRFFERKEIRDSIALLKLTINLDDDTSFLRMLGSLPLGIGSKTQEILLKEAKIHNKSLFITLKENFNDKYCAKEIFHKIFELNHNQNDFAFSEMLSILLNHSHYIRNLENKNEESRLLNINELIEFITKWESINEEKNFVELLDQISLDKGNQSKNKSVSVYLLTMHNAKGLEFPSVLIAGVNSTYMPFFLRKHATEMEEERRLLYVASTRAQNQLILSAGSEKSSRFLAQIGYSAFETVYSIEELIGKISGTLTQVSHSAKFENEANERLVEHPIFGKGRIINEVDENTYFIDFQTKGEKFIDTSLVDIKFL